MAELEIYLILYSLVPVILLTVTAVLAVKGSRKRKRCGTCTGTVTGFDRSCPAVLRGAGDGSPVAPIVAYTVNGRSYEFRANYYSTGMKVGSTVKVLYEKEDCSKASIGAGSILAPVITGSLGLLSILPILIVIVLRSMGIINF